jgi:hypothetical protein
MWLTYEAKHSTSEPSISFSETCSGATPKARGSSTVLALSNHAATTTLFYSFYHASLNVSDSLLISSVHVREPYLDDNFAGVRFGHKIGLPVFFAFPGPSEVAKCRKLHLRHRPDRVISRAVSYFVDSIGVLKMRVSLLPAFCRCHSLSRALACIIDQLGQAQILYFPTP